ncbi:MAG: GatB/YqeY domain-containing protein [Deltaproteobacteria bacterium]|nr:GatB/YqeY domain-containing protein [Deltaproteobacteria bacterium]
MTTPQERVQDDLKQAMKAGDKIRVGCLRMLLTEIKNEKIRAGEEVSDDRFLGLVRKGIKQRQESAEQFHRGDRQEQAEKEEQEAAMLEAYLPAQVSEEDLTAAIRELVAAEGLSGPAAMGQVMKAMMARFGAAADGRVLSRIAREVLAGNP